MIRYVACLDIISFKTVYLVLSFQRLQAVQSALELRHVVLIRVFLNNLGKLRRLLTLLISQLLVNILHHGAERWPLLLLGLSVGIQNALTGVTAQLLFFGFVPDAFALHPFAQTSYWVVSTLPVFDFYLCAVGEAVI